MAQVGGIAEAIMPYILMQARCHLGHMLTPSQEQKKASFLAILV
jgi:hypothetical protein